jgi:hypothetical protein
MGARSKDTVIAPGWNARVAEDEPVAWPWRGAEVGRLVDIEILGIESFFDISFDYPAAQSTYAAVTDAHARILANCQGRYRCAQKKSGPNAHLPVLFYLTCPP